MLFKCYDIKTQLYNNNNNDEHNNNDKDIDNDTDNELYFLFNHFSDLHNYFA